MPREPALPASGDRMSERSRHRVSGGQDAHSERPATGHGWPRAIASQRHPPETKTGTKSSLDGRVS